MPKAEFTSSLSADHAKIRVIYIAGLAHSGTRFLTEVLGSQPGIFAAGQVKHVSDTTHSCSCTSTPANSCSFWRQVMEDVTASGINPVGNLLLNSTDHERFCTDNLALFRAIRSVSGDAVIVDGSRTIGRLIRLLQIDELQVIPIWMRRDSREVVNAHVRKGRNWLKSTVSQYAPMHELADFFLEHDHISISYDQLLREPETAIREFVRTAQVQDRSFTREHSSPARHEIGGRLHEVTPLEMLQSCGPKNMEFGFLKQQIVSALLSDFIVESNAVARLLRGTRGTIKAGQKLSRR